MFPNVYQYISLYKEGNQNIIFWHCPSPCRDKEVCNKYFILVCVRMFLEKCEQDVLKFMGNFQRHTVSDEKVSSPVGVLFRQILAFCKC